MRLNGAPAAESLGATRHVFFVLAALALLIGSIDSTIVVLALCIPDRARRSAQSVAQGRVIRIVDHRGPARRLALEPGGLVAMQRQAA